MKKTVVWFVLFQKRILKKPMFQITLVLIPALLALLFAFSKSGSAMVKVALYAGEDAFAQEFTERLVECGNEVIYFYQCDSAEELRRDVMQDRAECGYIMAENMGKMLYDSAVFSVGDVITAVSKESSVTTRVVDELVCGKMFPETAFYVFESLIISENWDKKFTEEDRLAIREQFEANRMPSMMFEFQYADGSENVLLNGGDVNYYMMPVRGMLAVLILVATMSGVVMLSVDDKKGVWQWIHLDKRPVFSYVYILLTGILITVCSLIAIQYTGIGKRFLTEGALMLAYLVLVAGFCNFIRVLVRNIYFVCSLIPIFVLLSLVLCPVFIDLGSVVPGVDLVRLLIPTNYYLDAVYSTDAQMMLYMVAIGVTAAGIILDRIKERLSYRS